MKRSKLWTVLTLAAMLVVAGNVGTACANDDRAKSRSGKVQKKAAQSGQMSYSAKGSAAVGGNTNVAPQPPNVNTSDGTSANAIVEGIKTGIEIAKLLDEATGGPIKDPIGQATEYLKKQNQGKTRPQ